MFQRLGYRVRLAALFSSTVAVLTTTALADGALRPLTTDRPDLTESPMTVNPGHIQVESTLVGYAKSRTDKDGMQDEVFEFATTNVRFGLTSRSEIGFSLQPFGTIKRHQKGRAQDMRLDGMGSLQIRSKVNIFGNDRFDQVGDAALAFLPFVTIPTNRNNSISASHIQGGLIVPFAVVLPLNFGLGLNAGVSAVNDGDGNGYDAELFLSAALAYEWTSRFGTYYEVAASLRSDTREADTVLVGTGFTYALGANTQLDGGINFGVTDASERFAPFVGMTHRF